MAAAFAFSCGQPPQLPLPPPHDNSNTTDEASCSSDDEGSSGTTDDEGGLDEDDDVFPASTNHHQEGAGNPPTLAVSAMSQSPQFEPGQITMREKLIRSHTVWYLTHIGRPAASHLLRGKEPGTFIVRQSSKVGSMALSIRLPPESGMDIDHYLIETTHMGVRLEGSPNYFPTVPLLLEYYCTNGDELQTKLCLPSAIMDCETRRDIQSLALLGQDFWSSGLSEPSRSTSQASSVPQQSSSAVSPRPAADSTQTPSDRPDLDLIDMSSPAVLNSAGEADSEISPDDKHQQKNRNLKITRRAPPPPLKPKPGGLLRREKSDLGWVPPQRKCPLPVGQVGGGSSSKNSETMSSCVEELRQSRLESLKSSKPNSLQDVVIARQDGSPHVVRDHPNIYVTVSPFGKV